MEKFISLTRRSLPSFHGGFIALVLDSYKSWSSPTRAKPCETQSLTESLSLTGFFVFSIYSIKVSQCTRLHFVSHYNDIYIIEISACNTERIISVIYMHAWHEVQGGAKIYEILCVD